LRARFRVLALVLACVSLAAAPSIAGAQVLMPEPQTKQEAKQAAQAASESSSSTGSDRSLEIGLVVLAFSMIGGAAWWIMRDAGDAVGDERRAAPGRPLGSDAVGRGAPRTMFTGDSETGGKAGKQKKRAQGRRQRQARKANRPR
jgi:hypothetical protein